MALLLLIGAAVPPGAEAQRATGGGQIPYDARTEVRSIGFEMQGGRSIPEAELRARIALTTRGRFTGVRRAASVLPLVQPPAVHSFHPLTLQRDVARLRALYAREGFPWAAVDYRVTPVRNANLVDVVFTVDEGEPLLLREVRLEAPPLAPELQPPWQRAERRLARLRGERATEARSRELQLAATRWLRSRGYPAAAATVEARTDSAARRVDLVVQVEPGVRARVGEVVVEGTRRVDPRVVRTEMALRSGDWFDGAELQRARARVEGLELFRDVRVQTHHASPTDTVVDVVVTVDEAPLRLWTGEAGYISESGISTRAQWAHRNFFGSARSLSASLVAETGALAVEPNPDRRIALAATSQRPHFLRHDLSVLLRPSLEVRDHFRDRSAAAAVSGGLILQLAPLQSVSADYTLSHRWVEEYRTATIVAPDAAGPRVRDPRALRDSIGATVKRSAVGLSATLGDFDPAAPASAGFRVQPALSLAVPSPLTDLEYLRLSLATVAAVPLARRVQLVGRASAGRAFAYGKSLPAPGENPALAFARLQEVAFTAGGADDVRGWANRMLGPKFVDLRVENAGTDSARYAADRWIPDGGLARLTASAELRLPFPGLGELWGTHAFLDAGRIWTPDDRFRVGDPLAPSGGWLYSVGGGVDLHTPLGPVRLSLARKLNPDLADLADAADFAAALNTVPFDPDAIPRDPRRRWAVHLSIGSAF